MFSVDIKKAKCVTMAVFDFIGMIVDHDIFCMYLQLATWLVNADTGVVRLVLRPDVVDSGSGRVNPEEESLKPRRTAPIDRGIPFA